jgi:hypothetical protein
MLNTFKMPKRTRSELRASKLINFCYLCCLVLIMVLYGFMQRGQKSQNNFGDMRRGIREGLTLTMLPDEVHQLEVAYETKSGWIMPPPVSVGKKHWGVRCVHSSDCAYPWRCNGLYCDSGSRSYSR